MTTVTACPPIPSTDPDWPQPTLCQHPQCAVIRRDQVRARPTPDEVTVMCLWLIGNLQAIRQDEAAAELLRDLKLLQGELRAAVDNRAYRYAGPCTAVLRPVALSLGFAGPLDLAGCDTLTLLPSAVSGDPGPCGADLKLRVGAHTIVCRVCGAEYDADERAAWIDKRSADEVAPAALIAQALAEADYPVKLATIRKWAQRTREWAAKAVACSVLTRQPLCEVDGVLRHEQHPIEQVACQVGTGLPLYRVGQVFNRVKADPARRRHLDQIGA